MSHIAAELLQRYLAGEADLTELTRIDSHLPDCEACTEELARIAAEEAALVGALRLDEAETAWAASLDLTQPVMLQLRPWYSEPQFHLIGLLLLIPAGWIFDRLTDFISQFLAEQGTVGLTIKLSERLVPGVWRLSIYLSQGGLFTSLWPVLLIGVAFWAWRRANKEVHHYA